HPSQLPGDHAQSDDDQPADTGGRSGADQCVSEAEFIDRNTKTDHQQARKKGERTDPIQQSRHALFPILSYYQRLSPYNRRLNSSGNVKFSPVQRLAATPIVELRGFVPVCGATAKSSNRCPRPRHRLISLIKELAPDRPGFI